MNKYFQKILGLSLLIIAMACANGSNPDAPEPNESQNLSERSSGAVDRGTDLHRRRDSQIDSVIKDFTLDSTTISFGTLFYWTNLDDATHRIVSGTPDTPTSVWDSGDLKKGENFKVEFLFQGQFDYFCSIHPFMRGSIRVVGATNNYEEHGFHM